MADWLNFPDRAAQAEAVAVAIADALGSAPATLAVAGGTTPGPVFDRLSRMDLDWRRVTVTLTDERWVADGSPLANARLVCGRLLVGLAAEAGFIGLKVAGANPAEDAAIADRRLRPLAPFAAVLLGMGADGHIASLFPGAPELSAGLDPAGERFCVPVAMSSLEPRVPRLTLTLAALLSSLAIFLLIDGEAKRKVIEDALAGGGGGPPVAAVLSQARVPVTIFWAP